MAGRRSKISAQERADLDHYRTWRANLLKTNSDVGNLLLSRYIFQETQRVIARKQKLEGVFVRWLRINYVNTVALGIRRQLDTDPKTVSLANLLRSLIAKPNVITRERYLAVATSVPPDLLRYRRRRRTAGFVQWMDSVAAHSFFDKVAAPNSDHVSREVIGSDLKLLQQRGMRVERFATKRLAHYDITPPAAVKYEEIDAALDTLDDLLEKYNSLIHPTRSVHRRWQAGVSLEGLYPGWKQVFERPWNAK